MKKSYLITGAAGFIGSRIASSCQAKKIQFTSVDRKEFFKNRPEKKGISFGEVIDLENLFDYLEKNRPHFDAIIHMGAITDTRANDLTELNRLNLEYSKSLWTYATQMKIPFIYASSAATYGDGQSGYDDREDLMPQLKPLNAYGDSKLKFDLWALDQEKKGNHPPIWSGYKFFNVYGYGEAHKGFMSSVVFHAYEEILKDGQVTLFKSHRPGIADGMQKRDFVFVDDIVDVIHFALEKPIQRGIYNLGSGQARPFLDLARAVFKAMGKPEKLHFIETPLSIRDKYQYFTEAEMGRLKAQGYTQPFTSLEEGAQKYIQLLKKSI